MTATNDGIVQLRGVIRDNVLVSLLDHNGADLGVPVTAKNQASGAVIVLAAADRDVMADLDPHLPRRYRRKTGGKSFVWAHPATSTDLQGSYVIAVPTGGGYYDVTVLGKAGTACIQPAKRFVGVAGTFTHHAAGGVIKTGTWVNSVATYAPSGSTAQSSVAGDGIELTVHGHTLVHRGVALTNGGYGVVAIDGDYTAANRLPVFSNDDLAAGLCRPTDVGKRYICSYGVAIYGDLHTPLAESLADGPHIVRIEVCGTKPAAASAARVYVGGIVAASASDTTSDLAVDSRMLGYVEDLINIRDGGSAMVYTPEVEKSAAGTWEFLGEVHGGETLESLTITVDGIDQTAMAINAMVGGSVIKIDRISTLANSDAPGVPVCRKSMMLCASALADCPITVAWRAHWLVAKRVRNSYPLMLPLGKSDTLTATVSQSRWNGGSIGAAPVQAGDFSGNAGASHGNAPALYVTATGSQHRRSAFAALLDGGKSVNFYAGALPGLVFLHDRTDRYDKFYFCRSTASMLETFAAGDEISGVVGFGTIPE